MPRNTFSLYLQKRSKYPKPYFFKCRNCFRKVFTDLYMDYRFQKQEIWFIRDRFCNCKPSNNQKIAVAKINENQEPVLSRTLIE